MASGDVILTMFPACAELPASNAAQLGFRNGHPILKFSASVQESAFCTGAMRPYSGGGITLRFFWSAATATAGDMTWEAAIERIEDEGTNVGSDSFAADGSVVATAPANSGQVQYSEITLADGAAIDSVVEGELFRLRIRRPVAGAMSGIAELHCVEVRES